MSVEIFRAVKVAPAFGGKDRMMEFVCIYVSVKVPERVQQRGRSTSTMSAASIFIFFREKEGGSGGLQAKHSALKTKCRINIYSVD